MNAPFIVDPPEMDLLLKQLRLPTMRAQWRSFTERADRQDARQLRLHPRVGGLEGARPRTGDRGHLARGGRQRVVVRPARYGKKATWRRVSG